MEGCFGCNSLGIWCDNLISLGKLRQTRLFPAFNLNSDLLHPDLVAILEFNAIHGFLLFDSKSLFAVNMAKLIPVSICSTKPDVDGVFHSDRITSLQWGVARLSRRHSPAVGCLEQSQSFPFRPSRPPTSVPEPPLYAVIAARSLPFELVFSRK